MTLPDRSQVVVVGGGVVGCSIAYHLARRGVTDVLLLERKSLTHGSTWHAAGLVGQLRSSSNLTQLMRQSVQTYQALEAETGYPTGWHGVGSLRLASSPQRWEELKRMATTGRSFGFDVELVSAAEARELFPLIDPGGVHGATWVASDGYADPSQLTHSFATGARAAGVRIEQGCRVLGFERHGRRVTAVLTDQGRIECETVVNATGMWGAETAHLAGVDVAVSAVEHQYVVTEPSNAIPADLPTLRDPDARIYLKPENGALVVGGWEDGTRAPWRKIPVDLGPELFAPDEERFEPLGTAAAQRIPLFGEIGIRTWVNGPIPFSPDAEPLMGVTEDLDNLFHCCGFSAGIAAAGGAGHAMAGWIIDGDPGLDLWPFDVRRFGPSHNVPAYLRARSVDAYEHYYDIAFPNRELTAPRGQRRSPLYAALVAKGAVLGTKFGWERANWFAPDGTPAHEEPTFGRSASFAAVAAEHRAVREAVGVVDQSSFAKFEIAGAGALELMQRVAGANLDVPVGKVVYTQLLNANGGIEADVTVTRRAEELFYLVTGSGFGRHDVTFLLQHAPTDGSVSIREVTSAYAVLNVCGRSVAGAAAAAVLRGPGPGRVRLHDRPGGRAWATHRSWRCGRRTWASWAGSCTCRWSTPRTSTSGSAPPAPGSGCATSATARWRACAWRSSTSPGPPTSARTTTRTRPAWRSRCGRTSPTCSPVRPCARSGTTAEPAALLVLGRTGGRHARRRAAHPRLGAAGHDRAQCGLRPHGAAHDLLGVPAGGAGGGDRVRRRRGHRALPGGAP